MKTKIFTIILLWGIFFATKTYAQSSDRNYMLTYKPTVEKPVGTNFSTLSKDEVITNIQYFDDIGRKSQTVMKSGSFLGKDVVQPVRYDSYGRQSRKFLPYPENNSDGVFMSSDSTDQVAYYSTVYGTTDGTKAFAETVYDGSPLNRIVKQGAPGASWQPNQHPVTYTYGTNSLNEVKKWKVVNGVLVSDGYYAVGTLRKTTMQDEDSRKTDEFVNALGQSVMKIAWNGSTAARTSYVYDEFGLLRFVLPPAAMADNSISSTELANYCYQYTYDGQKRIIKKQLPGEDEIYTVYNNRNLVVSTQNGEQRNDGKWMFFKYDIHNRLVAKGVVSDSRSIVNLQNYINSLPDNSLYESEGSQMHGYTNNAYPTTASSNDYLVVKFYDDYGFGDRNLDEFCHYPNGYLFIDGYVAGKYFPSPRGLVTGEMVQVLGDANVVSQGTWLYAVYAYDERSRTIGTIKSIYQKDYLSYYDLTTVQYDFAGNVTDKNIDQVVDGMTLHYTYDHMGRLTKTAEQDYNGSITVGAYKYNELGQMDKKTLGGELGVGAQDLNYKYNIRGWLSQINDPSVDPGSTSKQKWNMALYYNTAPSGVTANPQYNGNIAGMVWNTPYNSGALSPTGKQGYGFTYDGMSRLTMADYGEGSSLTANANANNVTIPEYDLNGNIKQLTRQLKGTGTIDNLSYTYLGNHLQKVDDSANDNVGFIEGVPQTTEYTYDDNGNLTSDVNKGISKITYNTLDLPEKLVSGNVSIYYLYDAEGNKVCKIRKNGTTVTDKVTYAGSFVYYGSVLAYKLHEEGRIYSNGGYPVDEYFLKDHLGNTRMVVNGSGTVLQQTDYYPFGMAIKTAGSSDNKYLYNGKELENYAIGNGTLDWYDYGARMYDATLGRWHVMDPLSEKNYLGTPYGYVNNNPLRMIDPTGKLGEDFSGNPYYDLIAPFNVPFFGEVDFWSRRIDNKPKNNGSSINNGDDSNRGAKLATTEAENDNQMGGNITAVRDATYVSPRCHMPGDGSSPDYKEAFGTINTIWGTIEPNKVNRFLGWGLTGIDLYKNVQAGNYSEGMWNVIDGAGGIYSVGARGLYHLSQTEYVQTEIGRKAYKEYMYNVRMYQMTGKEVFLNRASRAENTMRRSYYNIMRKK